MSSFVAAAEFLCLVVLIELQTQQILSQYLSIDLSIYTYGVIYSK